MVTGWVRIQSADAIRTRGNSILMEEKTSDSRWSAARSEFLSAFSVPQANPEVGLARCGDVAARVGWAGPRQGCVREAGSELWRRAAVSCEGGWREGSGRERAPSGSARHITAGSSQTTHCGRDGGQGHAHGEVQARVPRGSVGAQRFVWQCRLLLLLLGFAGRAAVMWQRDAAKGAASGWLR